MEKKISNSFKECQENKEKNNSCLKFLDLNMEIETIKKTAEEISKMENLEKQTGTTDATNRIQEKEERILDVEDTSVKKKC